MVPDPWLNGARRLLLVLAVIAEVIAIVVGKKWLGTNDAQDSLAWVALGLALYMGASL